MNLCMYLSRSLRQPAKFESVAYCMLTKRGPELCRNLNQVPRVFRGQETHSRLRSSKPSPPKLRLEFCASIPPRVPALQGAKSLASNRRRAHLHQTPHGNSKTHRPSSFSRNSLSSSTVNVLGLLPLNIFQEAVGPYEARVPLMSLHLC